MTARKELLDFWASRANESTTCGLCSMPVPSDLEHCPHCGEPTDLKAGCGADCQGTSKDSAGRLVSVWDCLVVLACWFVVGVSLRFWLVGMQVEWSRVCEWMGGG